MSTPTQQEKKQGLPLFLDWAKALGVPVITLIVSIYGNQIVDGNRENQKVLDQIQKNQIELKLKMEAAQELQDAKNDMFEKELQGIKREIEYWRN
jgi:serine phosphatase RsbU (regulator of sigma subunit)